MRAVEVMENEEGEDSFGEEGEHEMDEEDGEQDMYGEEGEDEDEEMP
jgi:hypothetical protein